jgi:hypothetical protein
VLSGGNACLRKSKSKSGRVSGSGRTFLLNKKKGSVAVTRSFASFLRRNRKKSEIGSGGFEACRLKNVRNFEKSGKLYRRKNANRRREIGTLTSPEVDGPEVEGVRREAVGVRQEADMAEGDKIMSTNNGVVRCILQMQLMKITLEDRG